MKKAVSESRKAFSGAHRNDKDRQTYSSASQHASCVIAKAEAEAWQATCSFLSPKSNLKSVHSFLCSVAGSSSSSSFSFNFLTCFSSKEWISFFNDYLISHFPIFQPKTLRSKARGCLSELRRAICSEESHSSLYSLFSPAEFLAAATNLSSSTATGLDKVAYPMLKALSSFWHGFSPTRFQTFLVFHSFLSIWKTSSIIPIYKM